ncbi:MAG: HlyD family secretion protein [Bacteroidota bacterium]
METNNMGEEKKNPKKTVIRILLLLILSSAAYWAISKYLYARNHEETDDAQLDADISPVSSRVSGYVSQIFFSENQSVHQGDTLITIDPSELLNKVAQAEAAVASAEAALSVARAAVATASANLNSALATIDAAKVRVWKADRELARISNLQKEEAGTLQQYDAAKAEKDAADAQLVTATRQKEGSSAALQVANEQINVSASNIRSRQVELDYARLQLSYAVITAPVSGVAARKNI